MWVCVGREVTRDILSSLKRLPKVEERGAVRRKWRMGACQDLSILPLQQSLPERKAGHFRWMRACWGQGGPLVGPGSHCCVGGADRKVQLVNYQNKARHPLPLPKLRPARKRAQGGAKGAVGPHKRKAAKPGSLPIVWLAHFDGSPFRTQKQYLRKTKQLGSPLPILTWGPCWSWGQTLSTSCGSWPSHKKRVMWVISCRSTQWRTMKSGLSGGGAGSTHPTGGGS